MANGEETGRRRASRIRTDFYKTPDRIHRLRKRSITLLLVILAIYLVSGFRPASVKRYSHGPLCRSHATFEMRCHECHVDFNAIQSNAWGASWKNVRAKNAAKCNKCHSATGHHAALTDSYVLMETGCSSCHREHRGLDADLTRVSDSMCSNCHKDLRPIRRDAGAALDDAIARVTNFAPGGHPKFRSLDSDAGNVKFDHHLHMTAGLTKNGGTRGAMTIEDLPDGQSTDRYRLPGQTDQEPIQLTCSSCHQRDDGGETGLYGADGEYMLPINYELHCQTCHPLKIQTEYITTTLPHGLSLRQVEKYIEKEVAATYIFDAPEDESVHRVPRPIPGKHRLWNEPSEEKPKAFQDKVSKALLPLMHSEQGCRKCHALNEQGDSFLDGETPSIPRVWFKHARFDHRAHQSLDCKKCHPHAFAASTDEAEEFVDHEKVMIRGIESCAECHTEKIDLDVPFSGTRSSCVTCHRYHVDMPEIPSSIEQAKRGYGKSTVNLIKMYDDSEGSLYR